MEKNIKQKYMSSAAILIVSTIIVKVISAFYKIPLTSYIGSVGRGYFSVAYNLFMPIHAIAMGAFPIAVSKLVSKSIAKGNDKYAFLLKKGADKILFIAGIIGCVFMLIFAKPYSELISSSPKSIYTIFVLAPSAIFCSMASSRRAFCEGNLNMVPTAVSQTLEALFKMIFGLLFARLSMSNMYSSYINFGMIFGNTFQNESEALSYIYPWTSACSMLGVTLGSIISFIFVSVYTRNKYDFLPVSHISSKEAQKDIWHFSLALIGVTIIESISVFADTSSIQYCLSICDKEKLTSIYSGALSLANISKSDITTYFFGLYSSVLDFKNLIPGIVMALGVTSVPAISSVYENSSSKFSELMTSIFKYSVILCAGGGGALALFSKEILTFFYSSSNPDIVVGGNALLFWFSVTIIPCAFSTTTIYVAQALGLSKNLIVPFIVSTVIRVVLNFVLVTNENINLFGGVISSFVGYFIIMVSSLYIIRKKTRSKIGYIDVFFKPIVVTLLTYFSTHYILISIFSSFSSTLYLFIGAFIFALIFISLLVFSRTLTLSDFKFQK